MINRVYATDYILFNRVMKVMYNTKDYILSNLVMEVIYNKLPDSSIQETQTYKNNKSRLEGLIVPRQKLLKKVEIFINPEEHTDERKQLAGIEQELDDITTKILAEIAKQNFLKVCAICGETFSTTESWRDTCPKCSYKPMYPDPEAADETLGH